MGSHGSFHRSLYWRLSYCRRKTRCLHIECARFCVVCTVRCGTIWGSRFCRLGKRKCSDIQFIPHSGERFWLPTKWQRCGRMVWHTQIRGNILCGHRSEADESGSSAQAIRITCTVRPEVVLGRVLYCRFVRRFKVLGNDVCIFLAICFFRSKFYVSLWSAARFFTFSIFFSDVLWAAWTLVVFLAKDLADFRLFLGCWT